MLTQTEMTIRADGETKGSQYFSAIIHLPAGTGAASLQDFRPASCTAF